MIPDLYEIVLLAVAAWRTFQLLSDDDILDRPRRWALHLGDQWEEEGDPVPDNYRFNAAAWLACPYCSGAWIGAAWWLAWLIAGDWALLFSTPLVISSVVIGLSKILFREQ